MDAVFLKLLSLSASAAIIALVVMILRLLLKSAPKWITCSLWVLVALRLVIPFSIESRFSLMPEPSLPEAPIFTQQEELPEAPELDSPPAPHQELPAQPLPPMPPQAVTEESAPKDPGTFSWKTALILIWAVGALSMVSYEAYSYGKLRKKVAASLEAAPGIYICDYIDSPFVLGIFRPRIYLPSCINPQDKPYILAHEKAHIERLDPLWKTLGSLLLAIHWFNPVLWAAFILFSRDMESACDEKVIRHMGEDAKVPYSDALLNCSLPKTLAYPLAFGEVGVKQRIKEVLNYKKPTLWITIFAVIALLLTALCFLTTRSSHTLMELDHITLSPEVRLMGRKGAYTMTSQEEMAALEKLLRSVSYDPEPMPLPFPTEEFGKSYIDSGSWEQYHRFAFSPDFTAVGVGDETGIHTRYAIKNPEPLEKFFKTWAEPFHNREVSEKAEWTEESPWTWTKNIRKEMLEVVRMNMGFQPGTAESEADPEIQVFSRGGLMNSVYIDQVIDALHKLNSEDFVSAGETTELSYYDLCQPENPNVICTTLALLDQGNQKTFLFRMEGETTELYITDDYNAPLENKTEPNNCSHWVIKNPALSTFCQQFGENPPTTNVFVGWEYDWKAPMAVEHGKARIEMRVIDSWEAELIPYIDLKTPFGIRIRPAGEEGSLFYSFWPQGHYPVPSNHHLIERMDSRYGTVITGYPEHVRAAQSEDLRNVMWSFQRYPTEVGDYVIVNEGADSWFFDHLDEFSDMNLFCKFRTDPPDLEETPEPPDAGNAEENEKLSSLEGVGLFSPKAMNVLKSEKEMRAVRNFLKTLSREKVPIPDFSQDTPLGRRSMTFLTAEEELEPYLSFSDDGSCFFLIEDKTIREAYELPDPKIINDFFYNWLDLACNQQVSGAAVWNDDAPWVWTQSLRAENIPSAFFPELSVPMLKRQLDQFIPYLNTLEEKDFTALESKMLVPSQLLYPVSHTNFCVFLFEPENSIAAAFIYSDGETRLLVSHQLSEIQKDPGREYLFSRWKIDSEKLGPCLIQLRRDCPDLTTFLGWRYEWTEANISHKDQSISLRMVDSWEQEMVPYVNDQTPWGIRIRPPEETEGWLFFSFWPTGFHKEEENHFLWESSAVGFDKVFISYPNTAKVENGGLKAGAVWSYQLYEAPEGDYVIVNEGADRWFSDYEDQIVSTIAFCRFSKNLT